MVLRFGSESMNDSLLWSYSKATPGWTEGQVELRSVMVEEKYLNYRINVMAVKPGDMTAFIAVDDFAFHIDDICEIMPQGAGVTNSPTPSPSSTTIPPSKDRRTDD